MTKGLLLTAIFLGIMGCSRSYELSFDFRVNPPSDAFLREYFDFAASTSGIPYKLRDGGYYTRNKDDWEALESIRVRVESAGANSINIDVPNGCILSWFVSYLLDEDAIFMVRKSQTTITPLTIAIPKFDGSKHQQKYLEFQERCKVGT